MELFKKFNRRDRLESIKEKVDFNKLPKHIAIIMDGNGRWAKKRHVPRNFGHREGAETLKKITVFCQEIGLEYLTVYAFSTENWSRPKEEVEGLMKLFNEFLDRFNKEFQKENMRIRYLGDITALPLQIQEKLKKAEMKTQNNSGLNFNIALNYGGRMEIIQAVKSVARDIKSGIIDEKDVDEKLFSKYMYTSDMPDPDLIIRTSGELRLSNFLLWQSAYSELWFDNVLWPEFTGEHLLKAIFDLQKRERRFGGN